METMNKITAIVEKTDTGYSAYLPKVPGIATAAGRFSELRENIIEAINLYVETANEYKEEIPGILKGDYVVNLKFDIQPFME